MNPRPLLSNSSAIKSNQNILPTPQNIIIPSGTCEWLRKLRHTCGGSKVCKDNASSPSLRYEYTWRSENVSSNGLLRVSGNNKLRRPEVRPVAPKTTKGKDHCTYLCGGREQNKNIQKLGIHFPARDVSGLLTEAWPCLLSKSCLPTRIHYEPLLTPWRVTLENHGVVAQARRSGSEYTKATEVCGSDPKRGRGGGIAFTAGNSLRTQRSPHTLCLGDTPNPHSP